MLTILLLFRMARLYSKNFIQAEATIEYELITKVFGGWDFAKYGKYVKYEKEAMTTQLKVNTCLKSRLTKAK